jgi:alpha-tubulin suppressor-like RCC1 family protein
MAGGTLLTWGNGQQGQLGRVGERMSDRVKMETLLAPHAVPFKRVRCVCGGREEGKALVFVQVLSPGKPATVCRSGNSPKVPPAARWPAPHHCSGMNTRIVDVNCGTYATFATTADGHVFAFGLNNYGQLALPGGCAAWEARMAVGAHSACWPR